MRCFWLFSTLSLLLAAQEPSERKPDRVISISAERFTYSPSKINLKRGELVEFILTSEDEWPIRAGEVDAAASFPERADLGRADADGNGREDERGLDLRRCPARVSLP